MSNLASDLPREVFKTDGTTNANGSFRFDVNLGQRVNINQIALLFHNARRNSRTTVRSKLNSGDSFSALTDADGVPLQSQLDQSFLDTFIDKSNWTEENGAALTVSDRVATLTQQTENENESALLSGFSLPDTGTLLIDKVDDVTESGIVLGTKDGNGTYIRRISGDWEARTGDNGSLRSSNTEAAFGKRWEVRLTSASDFDFLVDGNLVFKGLPRNNSELRLQTEGAADATTSYRLVQVFSNTANDSFPDWNHFIARIDPPVTAQFLRFFIDNNEGDSGLAFQAGRLLVGGAWEAPRDLEPGYSIGPQDRSPRRRTRNQSLIVSGRPIPQRFDGRVRTFNDETDNFFDEFDPLNRFAGSQRPVLLTVAPDDVLRRHTRMIYGYMETRPYTISRRFGSDRTDLKHRIQIEELI